MGPNERHGKVGPNVNATKPELVGPTHLFLCLERDRTHPINFSCMHSYYNLSIHHRNPFI